MKVNWLRVAIIGAAVVAASILAFLFLRSDIEKDALAAVNKAQQMQFENMLQVQQNQSLDIQKLADDSEALQTKQSIINNTANAGLSAIRKLREESEKRHDEIHKLPDGDLNRIIVDGIAKYKADHE